MASLRLRLRFLTVVPKRFWVVANFKETHLAGMKVGQPATFVVDALPDKELHGHIERFSPADNATANFTKVTQRLPVRIAIDEDRNLT